MSVRTVSQYGVVRDRHYTSARDVAEGIVSCFDCCDETALDLIADVRITGRSACIVFTTKAHMVSNCVKDCMRKWFVLETSHAEGRTSSLLATLL